MVNFQLTDNLINRQTLILYRKWPSIWEFTAKTKYNNSRRDHQKKSRLKLIHLIKLWIVNLCWLI